MGIKYITDEYKCQDIIDLANKNGFLPSSGDFWSMTDNELDGAGVKYWLEDRGFKVIHNEDLMTHGIVTTDNGIKVSANGHCSLI